VIKFVEVKKITDFNINERKRTIHYELDEVWINPTSILQIKPDERMAHNLAEGFLPEKLDPRQEFSRVHFGSGNNVSVVTVVGPPATLADQIFKTSSKQLLKG
jgi:hypothetical protein